VIMTSTEIKAEVGRRVIERAILGIRTNTALPPAELDTTEHAWVPPRPPGEA